MNKFNNFASDMFNKIRGRFTDVEIGNENGSVTNVPEEARFFEFAYKTKGMELGKVSVSLDEENGVTVIVAKDFVNGQVESIQDDWYNFLKELRVFAKKRMLKFDVRDINKTNLDKRDYEFLAANRTGDNMAESAMYGSNRISYQKIGSARIAIKHSAPINVESASSRRTKIGSIFIESPSGEKFKYPFKHLSGARAMALHVSEGGHAYDDFGKYISGLSEEMAKLRKFNQYVGRSTVMAETLEGYSDVVKGRIKEVKQTITNLQKPAYYKEAAENFVVSMIEDVPTDIADSWVDQLTIKQFNEELKDVFPYIYNLVGEAVKPIELGPDDLDESALMAYAGNKKHGKEYMLKAAKAGREGASQEELGKLKDKYSKAEKNKKTREELELEAAFESSMGQFAEATDTCDNCGCDVGNPKEGCECDVDCHAEADDTMDVKINQKGQLAKAGTPEPEEKPKTPIGEFILSYFDRENGTFPKGRTAVLTMVEKDYGEQYVSPAAQFIEKIESMVAQRQAQEAEYSRYPETEIAKHQTSDIKRLAGI